jgi:ribosomal protein S7
MENQQKNSNFKIRPEQGEQNSFPSYDYPRDLDLYKTLRLTRYALDQALKRAGVIDTNELNITTIEETLPTRKVVIDSFGDIFDPNPIPVSPEERMQQRMQETLTEAKVQKYELMQERLKNLLGSNSNSQN